MEIKRINNNSVSNNCYGRLQGLILSLQNFHVHAKEFLRNLHKFGHPPSKMLADPGLVDLLRAARSGDRIPVGARFFARVQTGPGAHPTSSTMGTESFPEVKRPGRGADNPPILATRSRESRAIPLPLLWAFRSVTGYL
jgi:hypothetical protein